MLRKISMLSIGVTAALSLAACQNTVPAPNEELNVIVMSDTHVAGDKSDLSYTALVKGLEDIKNLTPKADVLINVGDFSLDGAPDELNNFFEIMSLYNPVSPKNTLIALGNHDVRGPDRSIWEVYPTQVNPYWPFIEHEYLTQGAPYLPDTQGKTYFDKWINGFHFIVINQENAAKDNAYITDEQLQWIEDKLAEDARYDKPIFVIVHQALEDSHWRSNVYDGFGPDSDELKAILAKYPQVITLSGHIHNGLGIAEVQYRPYATMIDVPSFNYNQIGLNVNGTGYVMEVSCDEVKLKARNFLKGIWLDDFNKTITLPTLPAVLGEINSLSEGDYTQDSWQVLEDTLAKYESEAKELMTRTYDQSKLVNAGGVMTEEWLFGNDVSDKLNTIAKELNAALKNLKKAQ